MMDQELKEAIKESLVKSHKWDNLVATVETEVINVLEKQNTDISKKGLQQPESIELINKLIYEYMDWMGYKLTNSLFIKESGTEIKMKNLRKQLTSSLDLEDNIETLTLPLLTVLITMFKNKNGDIEVIEN